MAKLYSYIFLFIISIMSLQSCSDSLESNSLLSFGDEIEISFSIPEMKTVNTRASFDENNIKSVDILIFPSDDESATLKQIATFQSGEITNLGNNRWKISLTLDKDLRKNPNPRFYAIANSSIGFEKDVTTLNSLKKIGNAIYEDACLTMSAKASLQEIIGQDMVLKRNAAKITVTSVSVNETSGEMKPDETMGYHFSLFGAAASGSITDGADDLLNPVSTVTSESDISGAFLSEGPLYIYPTEASQPVFIIMKAEFNGVEYYYRLDVDMEDKNTGLATPRDLHANHWYQILILDIKTAGYSSALEASRHPVSSVEYVIHDHAPVVYNMTTDGIRELGVSHEIKYDTNSSDYFLYVKCFSKEEDISFSSLKESVSILNNAAWISIGNPTDATDISSGNLMADDPDNKGIVLRYPLSFNSSTEEIGTLETILTVSWKGLSREVPVSWERIFNGPELADVSMKIIDATGNVMATISDYWAFLSSTDNGTPASGSETLWGIQPMKNNGKIRNQGLHFPVMYGDPGITDGNNPEARWSYRYSVTMPKLKEYEFDWETRLDGDASVTGHVLVNGSSQASGHHKAGDDFSFTVGRPGNAFTSDGADPSVPNDYEYGTGELTLHITPTADGEATTKIATQLSFDIYHTGFFHKDRQTHRVDAKDENSFYYYEVVPIMGAARMRYWLDRNLGAKSAGMYIATDNGHYGDNDAAGGLYLVADYKGNFEDPAMYDNYSDRVSPPGYRVPMQRVWDAMKNSSDIHTETADGHFSTYYQTSNPKIGKIYFPKSRFMENGTLTGETNSGYYWTQTPASGTEKEEIGRWLKALMISGSSSSYVNANVQTYAMSVRCVNDITDNETTHRTYFNVSGATHVYIYTKGKDGKISSTTSWPGHAIGNHSTMTSGKWFNFSYESTVFNPDNLYVIFNFLDEKGIIHSLSKYGDGAVATTDQNRDKLTGWKVIGDDIKGVSTSLGGWWKCDYNGVSISYSIQKP